jgi:catechol 2,3-dioxygenase-like lactoylglutathione lyase family enzyme
MSDFYNFFKVLYQRFGKNDTIMRNILITLSLLTMTIPSLAQDRKNRTELLDLYTVYITSDLQGSKDFYVKYLDFEVVFEATWFVYLQSAGEHKLSLGFIDETHPSTPPSYGAFDRRGSFLTLQVANVAEVFERLTAANAPIIYKLKKEDWGQIRFGLSDPNGLYIDIVQQVDPVPGFWEKYLPSNK